MDLTDNVDAVTPDSFSTGILDSSGNGLPTVFFDVFLQIGITAAATQTTHASDPNRPPPGCPDTPINLVAPTVKTVNPACDFRTLLDLRLYEVYANSPSPPGARLDGLHNYGKFINTERGHPGGLETPGGAPGRARGRGIEVRH